MIKKIIGLIIIIFTITACCSNCSSNANQSDSNQSGISKHSMVKDNFSFKIGNHTDYKFTIFEYDGHEYMLVSQYTYNGNGVSVIHLESCKYCKE